MSLHGSEVLVTGATGFVGSHLCATLLQSGAKVVRVVRRAPPGVDRDTHPLDLTDRAATERLIDARRPKFVVHLAAQKSRAHRLEAFHESFQVNALGTLNLAEACCKAGSVVRFVHLGTCEEYGDSPAPFDESAREQPVTAYGAAKLAATQLLQALATGQGLAVTILRPTLVYGPGQPNDMFLPALAAALLSGREFPMTAGEQTRDYLYVADLCSAIVKAMLTDVTAGTIINVGSGVSTALKDVANLVAREVGPDAARLLRAGALEYRPREAFDYRARLERSQQLLSWRAEVQLPAGIASTVAYARERVVT